MGKLNNCYSCYFREVVVSEVTEIHCMYVGMQGRVKDPQINCGLWLEGVVIPELQDIEDVEGHRIIRKEW